MGLARLDMGSDFSIRALRLRELDYREIVESASGLIDGVG